MDAITAANSALQHARNKLAKIGAANVRPAFATDVELVKWQMKQQGPKGAKGAFDKLRREKGYESMVWDMPSVIAYGKAAAKLADLVDIPSAKKAVEKKKKAGKTGSK